MAESILFDVAGSLLSKLGSLALQELGLIWGVNDELVKLKSTVSTIEAVLLDAEKQQSKSNAVTNWLSKLKDAFYDADDLFDEFSYEVLRRQVMTQDRRKTKQVRIFFSKSNQIAFGLQMGHKLKEFREKLDAIAADRTKFNFSEHVRDTQDDGLRESRYTHSFIREEEVLGRDDDKKAIIDHLMDTNIKEDLPVIAIVGIGGLGKTTLAQYVFNNEKIIKHFELKLWVCISEEFDVKTIVEKILESATKKKPESLELDLLQSKLRREIDGKKYLLILDDVWNDDYGKWVNLIRLLMGGAKRSRIVITTRSEQVAKTCDATIIYSLECLSEHASWLLFKQMAFKGAEEGENESLIKIGREIVAKLKGVPLAIRLIGRLLYYKISEVDWLSFKDNELYTVMQEEENEMQSILKLSYNHLPYNLKRCFTYCALFPKDYEIQKEEVIRQWIAQGFVQPHGINKPIQDVGDDYFMELLWRSFFQDAIKSKRGDITKCKMHDFMHDLSCSIVENECMLVNVDARRIDKRTRHVSFISNPTKKMELPESLFEAKKLRTFILRYDPNHFSYDDCNKPLLKKIFSSFLRLRTLNLGICWITELPTSISKLKHLRYLDLSGNSYIEFLPDSITELYNLETLMLRSCKRLRELPRDTKKWVNLRHLALDDCRDLTHMPNGLGGLTSLMTMNLFVLGKDIGSGVSELNGLNNLRGSLTIRGLEFCTTFDLEKNANYLKLKSGLRDLRLHWDHDKYKSKIDVLDDDERILECLQPHPNVQKIRIHGYGGMRLCDWLSSNFFVHLVTIKLSSCGRLQHLPQFVQFPLLKRLDLDNLNCVEYIDNNDSLFPSTFFPSLERLSISNMPKLNGWWKGSAQNGVSLPTFPCLSQLEIHDCSQLASIPWHPPLLVLRIGGVSMQLLNMVMKTSTNLAVESSSAMCKLNSLHLSRIDDLKFLLVELFCNVTTLEVLRIHDCHNLQMAFSRDGHHPIDEDEGVFWKKLASLHSLGLQGFPKLEHLPKGLQHLTTLRYLSIENWSNLIVVPEWISNLTLLSTLIIRQCPKLTSFPEGMCRLTSITDICIENCRNLNSLFEMHHLTSLSRLVLVGCPNLTLLPEGICHLHSLQQLTIGNCPKLFERCKQGIGKDWPKISHIPELLVFDGIITNMEVTENLACR